MSNYPLVETFPAMVNIKKRESFYACFSDYAIINQLINIRLKNTAKRNKLFFFRKITDAALDPEYLVPRIAEDYLPPRRSWNRPFASKRKGRTSTNINSDAIRRTINGYKKSGNLEKSSWGRRLKDFIHGIQSKVASSKPVGISKPDIFLKKKDAKSGDEIHYRVMAQYTSLEDRVIIALTAKYLRGVFDSYLLPEVYCYRENSNLTRHRAIEKLINYRKEHSGEDIYVAECDLKRFFDSVSHDVAKEALYRAVITVEQDGFIVERRAVEIVHDYIGSYSFNNYALPLAYSILKEKQLKGTIPGIENYCACSPNTPAKPVGIPQGGAISNIISNLILDYADKAVKTSEEDSTLFYARYCDDMIIMHLSQEKSAQGLQHYINAISKLKLSHHEPVKIETYTHEYYQHKSKEPYLWNAPENEKTRITSPANSLAIPWVSFLGYQIKYDGSVRVRKSSIQKEKLKVKQEISRICLLLQKKKGIYLTQLAIINRTRKRLYSMSTGRKSLRTHYPHVPQPCWSDAFSLMDMNFDSRAQLRSLDQNRHRQLRFLKKQLITLKIEQNIRRKNKRKLFPQKIATTFQQHYYSYYDRFRLKCEGNSKLKNITFPHRSPQSSLSISSSSSFAFFYR